MRKAKDWEMFAKKCQNHIITANFEFGIISSKIWKWAPLGIVKVFISARVPCENFINFQD